MITGWELICIVLWLLFPPLFLGSAFLILVQRRYSGGAAIRYMPVLALLFVLSFIILSGLLLLGPVALGRYIGVQDAPFMWAPAAFIAVGLALPLAILCARRKS